MASNLETRASIAAPDILPRLRPDGINSISSPTSLSNSPGADRELRASSLSSQRLSSGRSNDTLDPLRALPEVRPIPWYAGKELSQDKSTESTRVQTRGASLLASRGRVMDPPCNHCATGVGRFSQCIALDDWFHGACATCQLATRGNLCSLRKKQEDTTKPEPEQLESVVERIPSSETRQQVPESSRSSNPGTRNASGAHSQSESRPQLLMAARTPLPRELRPHEPIRAVKEYLPISKSLKRKRETLQGTSVWRPYVSPYAPVYPSNHLASSVTNTPIVSSISKTILPTDSTRNESIPVNYVQQRGNQHSGSKRHTAHDASKTPSSTVLSNGYSTPPVPIERGANGKDGRGREETDSLSPSAQLLQPLQSPTPEPPTVTHPTVARSEYAQVVQSDASKNTINRNGTGKFAGSRNVVSPDTPLIDTLPRRRQKQIYGMLGGLQSGIKSCQQQAESMQKQLNLLQAALGIDVDDDNAASMN